MKHYGDITKIKGNKVPIVDIVTGGSPCQDLSIAGKRAGLDGERSGLFMEQIRIVKEMHDECRRTNKPIRPRFMVWENVPGAFSSNGGEDFRTVLEETARITAAGVCIPRLEEGQRWPHAGCIMADGWSIAWRLHDAQYWGVPQRRKRISLIADFRGDTAPQILFKHDSMPRNFEEIRTKKEGTPGDFESDAQKTSWSIDRAAFNQGKNALYDFKIEKELAAPIIARGPGAVCSVYPINTMAATRGGKDDGRQCFGIGEKNAPQFSISAAHEHSVFIESEAIIRRLTPMECERLQGFPDGWTDIGEWTDSKGKKHKASDSPRYKALGNAIAVGYANNKQGFWCWMAERMVAELKAEGVEQPTMASLFDGIGGFPLAFSSYGCKPIWASEIEEFPIAVTKIRFPEQEADNETN